MAILEVKNLVVNYGAIRALKGISFDVNEGEIISLIGSNGAGKTTTLHSISNLIKKQSGSVVFDGEDITNLQAAQIVHRGLIHVPEGRRIFANLSVKDNLEMGAYTRNDKEKIKQDMEHVFELFPRMKERLKQLAGTLSGENSRCSQWAADLWQIRNFFCLMNRAWDLRRFWLMKFLKLSKKSTRTERQFCLLNRMRSRQ